MLVVEDMMRLEQLKLLYRIHNKLAPVPLINLFPKQNHSYNTRGSNYVIGKHSLTKYNHSFLVRSVMERGKLDLVKKNKEHVNIFKRAVKKSMIDKY